MVSIVNILELIESIAIIIAAGIGGAWAIYRFRSLKELDRAKTELKILKENLKKRGELKISMDCSQISSHLGFKKLLKVDVTIENIGNKSEAIYWKKCGLVYSRVKDIIDGKISLEKTKTVSLISSDSFRVCTNVSAGESPIFYFLIPIEKKGLYYLVFQAPASSDASEIHKNEIDLEGRKENAIDITWVSELFINVE